MAKDLDTEKPVFDPTKRYAYTWPGQPEVIVPGTVLIDLVKGADPSKLNVRELPEQTFERPAKTSRDTLPSKTEG